MSKEGLIVPSEDQGAAPKTERPAPSKKKAFAKPKLSKFGDMQDLLLLDPIHDVDQQGWPNSPENNPQG